MAIFRGQVIRGSQIQDRTVAGEQIIQKVITNEHIADNASIAETKIAIDWHAHTEALEDRKIVDFVQVNGIQISGLEVDLNAAVAGISGIAVASSDDSIEGIIASGSKNYAPMRDAISGEPIVAQIEGIDYEVIARVEYDEGNTKYVLKFYTASGESGAEVAYDIGVTPITVDFQYARRFNLRNIDEMFAANEKFVHGAADVTAYLNAQQLARDIYGDAWTLDRDGEKNLATSVVDQINAEISRAQLAETGLQDNIDAEATTRNNADTTLTNSINSEITNRTNADTAIQTELDATQTGAGLENNGTYTANLSTNYISNATSLKDADNKLDAQVKTNANNIAANVTAVSNEATARNDADIVLQNNIDAEATARNDADTGLQSNIDAEATARNNADIALQGNIDAEATARAAADTAIRTDLASNANSKGASLIGVEDVAGNFTATTVEDVLAEIQTTISTISNGGSTTQSELDTTQTGAGLNSDGTYTANASANYISNATSLKDADNKLDAQVKINTDNITNEATARTNADVTLQDNIDAEETARISADTTLQNNIDAEATARSNADATLQGNIDTEVSTRAAADTALQTELDTTQTGAGLNSDGTYTANASAHYINTATSLKDADNKLDTKAYDLNYKASSIKSLCGFANNMLNPDVTYYVWNAVPYSSSNYLTTVTSIPTALLALDAQIKSNNDGNTTILTDLASTVSDKGASLIGVDNTSGLNATTVQGVLVDHETRIDDLETIANSAVDRAATLNNYFTTATFATIDARLEDSEGIVDTNLKRIDDRDLADRTRVATANGFLGANVKDSINARFNDVESLADTTTQEVQVARGSKSTLDGRLDVAIREDGFLVDDAKIHVHKKYTIQISANTSSVNLPVGEKFNLSTATGSGSVALNACEVYINGILQSNGINFVEIADTIDTTKGVGVNFSPEELVNGDIVVIEWIVNNAN